ncbi:hypothetical protein [Pseudomonas sp. 5P_5.1_Bac1]|uniref:hypothetical protein n=1 Tax=Pseudomonas sp. 5P_5.1_Bac1 TaxID=2971616 RepID=UPI0021C5A279|nr:hypothetical protein [Pseudomonas sp. 5P_5.1_Bac1]MCU1722405.1 hypothetical protein [Pseudomonas sp. 5P_5.1_Bac1]
MSTFEIHGGNDRRSMIVRFERKSKQAAISELVDLIHCAWRQNELLEIERDQLKATTAATAAQDLDKAEGEQPDLNILHVAAPCAAAAVGRCQKAEGGQPCATEAESNKWAMLAFAATIGEICQALGIDGHSEPDMIVDAARELSTASTSLNLQLAELASLLEHWLQLGDASDSNLTDLMKETSALLDQDPPIWQRAAMDVLLERRRQIAKGYTADHDDQYGTNELAAYGVVHALLATGTDPDWEHLSAICLWEVEPGEPRTLLVKAIALLLAALESLDRCAERAQTDTELVRLRQLAQEVQRES